MRVVSFAVAEQVSPAVRQLGIHPTVALRWLLLLLAVGNLGRIPFLDLGEREAPLLINDLGVMAVAGLGAIAMVQARSLRLNSVALAAILFACIGALSAIASVSRYGLTGFELMASLAYLARWATYFSLYIVVINCVRRGEIDGIWRTIEWAMLLMAAFGIVQALFLPDFAFMVYPDARRVLDWDPQGNRLVSTVLEPNVISGMLTIVLLVQLARLSYGVKTPAWKPALLFAALVLTLSRSGALAFFTGSLLILSVRGAGKRLLKLALFIAILLIPAVPRLIAFAEQYGRFGVSDASALARVIKWQQALGVFVESPWIGVGFNTYGFVQEHRGFERVGAQAYSAEGGLLFIAVMTGLAGLAAYLLMLWLILRTCRRGWRSGDASPTERGLFLGTGAATIAILIHTMFVNSLMMPFVMELLWVLWALTFVAMHSQTTAAPRAALPNRACPR